MAVAKGTSQTVAESKLLLYEMFLMFAIEWMKI